MEYYLLQGLSNLQSCAYSKRIYHQPETYKSKPFVSKYYRKLWNFEDYRKNYIDQNSPGTRTSFVKDKETLIFLSLK